MEMQFNCNGSITIEFEGSEKGEVDNVAIDIKDKEEVQDSVSSLIEEVLSEYIDVRTLKYNDFEYSFTEVEG